MKKNRPIQKAIVMIALLLLVNCNSVEPKIDRDKKGELILKIDDLSSGNGSLRILVFDESGKMGFPDDARSAMAAFILPANLSSEILIKIPDLPYGKYAILYLHDENGNQAMDFVPPKKEYLFFLPNIPWEGYGYSNVNRPSIGTPIFDSASFVLDSESKTFEMYTSYFWRRYGLWAILLSVFRGSL
ncbi:MAG: DUF2141 domain-containing protein [Leptospiraceae bacterium]|nr:DUF2141 domain-containing protein [Leptospiraceae bacterium]